MLGTVSATEVTLPELGFAPAVTRPADVTVTCVYVPAETPVLLSFASVIEPSARSTVPTVWSRIWEPGIWVRAISLLQIIALHAVPDSRRV